ncbi:MAG TPA: flagellar assembly protein H, partial [Candidatus Xenobia bacterium]
MDHDRLFKKLLTFFPFEFIELFLPDLARVMEAGSLDFLDKEVFSELGIGDRREADIVARAKVRGQDSYFLIHMEHEAQHRPGFARR